jgi:hypothetical protein
LPNFFVGLLHENLLFIFDIFLIENQRSEVKNSISTSLINKDKKLRKLNIAFPFRTNIL